MTDQEFKRPRCGKCSFFDPDDVSEERNGTHGGCHLDAHEWREVPYDAVACSSFLALWHLEHNMQHNRLAVQLQTAQLEQALKGSGQIARAQIMPPGAIPFRRPQ